MMRKTIARTMVSWNSVFSMPRRVRKLPLVPPPSAEPMPEPLACRRMTTRQQDRHQDLGDVDVVVELHGCTSR